MLAHIKPALVDQADSSRFAQGTTSKQRREKYADSPASRARTSASDRKFRNLRLRDGKELLTLGYVCVRAFVCSEDALSTLILGEPMENHSFFGDTSIPMVTVEMNQAKNESNTQPTGT